MNKKEKAYIEQLEKKLKYYEERDKLMKDGLDKLHNYLQKMKERALYNLGLFS